MKEIPGFILKSIPGFPFYYADTVGNIWSTRAIRPNGLPQLHKLTPNSGRRGYLKTILVDENGRRKNMEVHRAVCLAFHGDWPGLQTRHLDGNNRNNAPTNLIWGTGMENQRDRLRHGTDNNGAKSARAKLDTKSVALLRTLYSSKSMRQIDLAAMFNISQSTVSSILLHKTWK
jgi:hypothetical protein